MIDQPCEKTPVQDLFDRAFRLKLPAPEKHVLTSMAIAASADGIYRRGTTFLVLATEYSESQVKRIIASLVESGLIEQVEASRGRKPASYDFHLENGASNPALQDEYLSRLRMQDEPPQADETAQNGRVQDEYLGDIGMQDEPFTHSHARQNGHLNGTSTVQIPVIEGENGQSPGDESVESYTEIPDIPDSFSVDSTDSLPVKVGELVDIVFIDKPDKTGRQKVAWLISKFGEPLVTSMLEHGAKLTGDSRPVHVNWLVKAVKNAMLEGRTPEGIRNRIPAVEVSEVGRPDDPDGRKYIEGKYGDFIMH